MRHIENVAMRTIDINVDFYFYYTLLYLKSTLHSFLAICQTRVDRRFPDELREMIFRFRVIGSDISGIIRMWEEFDFKGKSPDSRSDV